MRQASIGFSGLIVIISSLTVLAFTLLYLGGIAKRIYAGDDRGESSNVKVQKSKFKFEE